MDNTRLNLYKRFINSINGFNGYRQLLYESAGKAVLYVFLLTLLLGAVSIIQPIREIDKGVTLFADNFEKEVPNFELNNGVLTVEGKMPVIIKSEEMTIIIDTSENADQSILDDYDNAILLTRTQMIQKNYSNVYSASFDSFKGIIIDKEAFRHALPYVKGIIVCFLVLSIFVFIAGRYLSALLISVVGLIVNSSFKANLHFMDIYRISLYSMTLPLIICAILNLTGIINIVPLLLFYIISCVYTWGAITSIAKSNGTKNTQEWQ